MALDIVTGESEKSYGVVPSSIWRLPRRRHVRADGGERDSSVHGLWARGVERKILPDL
jgi:hypothetical protein